jgi:hypothetical protein
MKTSAICATRQAVFIHGATVEAIVDDVVDRTQIEQANVSTSNNKTPSDGLSDKDRSFSSMKGLDNENHQYTFMGYNARICERLLHGLGHFFPAFLTLKGAVNMTIIDLMCPLFNAGVRPKQLADILLNWLQKISPKVPASRARYQM